jgi:predicted nucleic acid-binding protein
VSTLLFPDNTVLVNFAIVARVMMLGELLRGNGRWTITIESECARSARHDGLEELEKVGRFLGDALIPTLAERLDTSLYRERLAKPGDSAAAHLGEAESFAIIVRRFPSAVFVTDDVAAGRLARALGLRTLNTAEVFKLAVHIGFIETEDAWIDLEFLRSRGRFLPSVPSTFHDFRSWCSE